MWCVLSVASEDISPSRVQTRTYIVVMTVGRFFVTKLSVRLRMHFICRKLCLLVIRMCVVQGQNKIQRINSSEWLHWAQRPISQVPRG